MEITKESLRQKFTGMETDELVALRDSGTRSDDAMDVIESILSDRGISFSTRNEIVERLADEQSKLTRASIGIRIAAQLIDFLLTPFIAIPFALLANMLAGRLLVGLLIGFFVQFLYLLFQDGLPNGQSLGKRFLQIAVVDKSTGNYCTYWKSFVRNIMSLLLVIDWLFIFTKSRQRLGDKAANTIVVNAQGRSV